eukprot:4961496-Alexandrium_andersonii.AAC.1
MTLRTAGLPGTASSSIWNFGPFSIAANALFRAVVVLSGGTGSCRSLYLDLRRLMDLGWHRR